MIDSLVSVGPPLTGLQNLRENRKAPEKAGKGAFEGILEDQSSDPPQREKITQSDSKSPKEVKPERKPEKAEVRALKEKSEAPKKKEGQTREQAIEKFMDSFESELGIPATRLVAAIANLSESEKKAAPEVTAEKVVHSLGLDPEQEQKAQALYAGLLQNLQSVDYQQVMPVIAARQENDFFIQRSQAQALAGAQKSAQAQKSIDSVTQSFWKKQPQDLKVNLLNQQDQVLPMGLEGRELSIDPSLQEILVPQEWNTQLQVSPQNPEIGASPIQGSANFMETNTQGVQVEQPPQSLKSRAIPITEMSPHALAAMITKRERYEGIKNLGVNSDQLMEASENNESDELLQLSDLGLPPEVSVSTEMGSSQSQNDSAKDQEAIQLKEPSSELLARTEGADLGQMQRFESKLLEALGVTSPGLQMLPSDAESQVNTQQILNQAKALMAKGGGEVKVQMTPEGMGSVHLKVLMQDGRMQIQIQAESQQTKSALESSLADLKTSLAAQKVSVDNIKVDVVNATSNETAAQNQNQFLDQHNQRETRQFWNQFNEHFGNQFKRNSFFESPSGRGYQSKSPTPLEPVQVSSTVKPKAVSGKGSGLNLVA